MEVRTIRVIWPITGTASENAGSSIRSNQPKGSSLSCGKAPATGSLQMKAITSKSANQQEGVARKMTEENRMMWSGQRLRNRGAMMTKGKENRSAEMRTKKVRWRIRG